MSAVLIAWETGGGRDAITESRQAEILTQIFSNRLFDAMREQLGASYSPNVASRWPLDRADGGTIVAMAQIEPDEMGEFFDGRVAMTIVDAGSRGGGVPEQASFAVSAGSSRKESAFLLPMTLARACER